MTQNNWQQDAAKQLIELGYRAIPFNTSENQPYGFKPEYGITYAHNDPKFANSFVRSESDELCPMISVALDDCVLLDYDGNKGDAISVDELAKRVGLSGECELLESLFQTNEAGDSLHFLFRITDQEALENFNARYKNSNDGKFIKRVDIKTHNQLMHIKPHKMLVPLAKADLKPCPAALLDALKRDDEIEPNSTPVAISDQTSRYGKKSLEAQCVFMANTTENRNSTLNVCAFVIFQLVWGGEIAEIDAVGQLSAAALKTGLKQTEINRTIVSAKDAAKSSPKKAPEKLTLEQLFAPVANNTASAPKLHNMDCVTLDDLDVRPCTLVGDHLIDALTCKTSVFHDRLAKFENNAHFWNGSCWEWADDSDIRKCIQDAMLSGEIKTTKSRVDGTLSILKDQLPVIRNADAPSMKVYFTNGALDLNSFELLPHDPANGNTRTLSAEYGAHGCPMWQTWLAEIFAGDPERADLLQEMLGWCLTRDSLGIEKALILIGPPRSGKGTLAKIIKRLLGVGAASFNLDNLDNDKILSGMISANVAIDAEATNPRKVDAKVVTSVFKSITSNDAIAVKKLWTQKPWNGALNCKLIALANSVPNMFDDSGATANRWIPLAFDKSFLGSEDVGLENRLATELNGIANWALIGLKRLIANGRFTMPQSSINELENIKGLSSPLTAFISDCFEFGDTPEHRLSNVALKTAYNVWCIQNHEENIGSALLRAVTDATRHLGVVRKESLRINGVTTKGFEGVKLKPVASHFQSPNVTMFNGYAAVRG